MNSRQFQELQEAYMNVYQEIDEAKSKLPTRGIDPEFYSQFYGNASRSKKVKGAKESQPGQNRYLTKQNQKRSYASAAKRYAADMGRDRTPSASDYDNHGGGSRNEQVDIYDVILSHLIDEGYASTEEAATAIMANMSEDWRDSVVEAYKDLPADKMIRKAGVKQFKHGMSVGSGNASNPKVAQQVGKMSAVALLHDPERAKAKSKMKKD